MVALGTFDRSFVTAAACAYTGLSIACGGRMESAAAGGVAGTSCCQASVAGRAGAGAALGGASGGLRAEPDPNALGGAPTRVVFGTTVPYGRMLNHGLLVEIQRDDHVVVASPSQPESTSDSGARLRWYAPNGSLWLERDYDRGILPEAIAIGPDDGIWMSGPVYRDIDFGAGTVSEVDDGYYVVKLSPTGDALFSFAVPTPASTWVHAIAVDHQGNAYVTGALNQLVASTVHETLFVAKYSADGETIYFREFRGSASTATPSDLAIAPNGDLVVAGYFNGTLNLGAQQIAADPGSDPSNDSGFVVALDPDQGTLRWARVVGGAARDWVASVDVTAWGALRIGGQLSGTARVGDATVSAANAGSPFVAELTAEGSTTWVEVLEGLGAVRDADTDRGGRTYAIGTVDGTSDFPMNDAVSFVVEVTRRGASPILRVSANANGGWGIAADHRNGLWVIGNFAGTVDFGPLTLTAPMEGNGAWYLLRLVPEPI